jgi:hypothetical protein
MKHLDSVPHSLTEAQKVQHVTLLNHLWGEPRFIKHQGWQFIVPLDESWFDPATGHEQIRLQPEEESPERPRHMIQDTKMILMIAWNPMGFHMAESVPKVRTGNAVTPVIIFSPN